MSANLSNAAGSLSPSLVERRIVSAMDCTCDEFTGSGNDATAASSAIFMMLMVSDGNDAFEKSFISCPIAKKILKDEADPIEEVNAETMFQDTDCSIVAVCSRSSDCPVETSRLAVGSLARLSAY